jgi:pimeloyl-ACP methyl ester carboxylesterase
LPPFAARVLSATGGNAGTSTPKASTDMPVPHDVHVSSQRRSRLALRTAACAALTVSSAFIGASRAAALPENSTPQITWTPCDDDANAQCGVITVPLDYRAPDGETIELAVYRWPAVDAANRLGALFVNPGGPGGTAVGLAKQLTATGAAAQFDVIGVDPRGVGGSEPAVACWADETYAGKLAESTIAFSDDPKSQAKQVLAKGREFGRACAAKSGEALAYIGTEFVARDMDVVRAALGEEQLSYLGLSYGTYLGTVYANLFPDRVRAMVLDGAYDPAAYTTNGFANDIRQELAAEEALSRFFDWCSRAGEQCAFGDGDPAGAFDQLVADLDAADTPRNGFVLTLNTLFALNSGGAGWPDIAAGLAAAQQGEGDLLLDPPFELFAANVAVECADRVFPSSPQMLGARLGIGGALSPRFGPLAGGPPTYDQTHAGACIRWPVQSKSRYGGPFDAVGAPPILVVGTTGDPDTPYADAVTLANTLSSGVLLTFDGEGHTATGTSECVAEKVFSYLNTLETPAKGTVCDDDAAPGQTSG